MMCFYHLRAFFFFFFVLERAEIQKNLTEKIEYEEISKISLFQLLHTELCTHFYLNFQQFDSVFQVSPNQMIPWFLSQPIPKHFQIFFPLTITILWDNFIALGPMWSCPCKSEVAAGLKAELWGFLAEFFISSDVHGTTAFRKKN